MKAEPIEDLNYARTRVLDLIENYKTNVERLKRYYKDETVREWANDFSIAMDAFGTSVEDADKRRSQESGRLINERYNPILLKKPDLERRGESDGARRGEPDLEAIVAWEKAALFSEMDQIKAEVEVVKLLMLQLRDVDYDLISYRYFQGFSVSQVCQTLFFSRSTFYRRHEQIINALALHYHQLFHHHVCL